MAAILFGRRAIHAFSPAGFFLFFYLSSSLCPVGSSNPTMQNPIITSQSNSHTADNSSNIVWGSLPKTKPNILVHDGRSDGLEPLFVFSRNFIYSAVKNTIPIEFIQKVKNGNLDLLQDLKKLVLEHLGFLVAVAIGVIFVVIFPIIGFCFCLCRCAGKCGGKMIQNNRSTTRRRVLSFLLLLGVAFSASGTAFMFASDARLMHNINEIPTLLPKVMNVVAKYGDNTYTQVDFVGKETVNFLLDVIRRDLNSLDVLVGIPIRDRLDNEAGITNIFTTMKNLANQLVLLKGNMTQTNADIGKMKSIAQTLNIKMTQLKTNIDNDLTLCGTTCKAPTNALDTNFSPQQIPDITNELNKLNGVDILTQIQKPEKDFNDIPELVHNKSQTKVQDVDKIITDIQKKIPEYLNTAKEFKADLHAGKIAGQDLHMLTNKSSDALDKVMPINKIRSYAFIGLAGFCLFIVALLFCGLLLGVCGHDDLVNPVKRGCVSNCGGCLLMTAVFFIFFTGWLLMLLTTVMFIPGAVVEVYGCKTLRDIGEGAVDDILRDVLNEDLGQIMFQNSSFDVKISHIYNGCERGEGVYKAAYLNYIVNFGSIFDYPKNMNVEKELNQIKVDLSSVEIYTPGVRNQLNEAKKSLTIDFKKYESEFMKINNANSLTNLASILDNLSKLPISSTLSANFQKHANDVRNIESNELKKLHDIKAGLVTILGTVKILVTSINTTIDTLTIELKFAQDAIHNKGTTIVKAVLSSFVQRFFRIWDSFVDYVKHLINYKIGQCRPITDIYNYVAIDMLCGIIDSFNAYWFGLGWCLFFFLFNLIIAVKLAKYYRRMNYSDELDGSDDILPTISTGNRRKASLLPNNKIGQMPRF